MFGQFLCRRSNKKANELTLNISNRASFGISTRSNFCFSLTAPLTRVSMLGQSVGTTFL